jgi:2-(1,2-epoxy-1,2-dihydrophenyl)acetyl-CoA isomerase
MDYETITYKKEAGVAYIDFNRPDKMNSLTDQMLTESSQAIDEAAKDPEVRVIVLTGSGRAFCAGADLGHPLFEATSPVEIHTGMASFHKLPLQLRNAPKPVIASVNGAAVGAGANLALACDMIIASDQARFGQVFVNIGVHPDTGGTYFLPRAVGVPRACELLMTGRIIDAKEAERIGMVNKVVPADKLEATTRELAESLAKGPPIALSMMKESIYQALEMDLPTALEREANCQAILVNSEDNREGIRAFREKRRPEFKGK